MSQIWACCAIAVIKGKSAEPAIHGNGMVLTAP